MDSVPPAPSEVASASIARNFVARSVLEASTAEQAVRVRAGSEGESRQ